MAYRGTEEEYLEKIKQLHKEKDELERRLLATNRTYTTNMLIAFISGFAVCMIAVLIDVYLL